jgi:hypothetical protein
MLLAEILAEKYTEPNSHLLRYLTGGDEFDPFSQWQLVCQWVEDNDGLEEVSEIIGEPVTSADELNDYDPDIFTKFPDEWQSEIAGYVTEWLANHAPEELPSTHFLAAADKRLLPAQTWLVHFSDAADDIQQSGFKYGMRDVAKLGLTTYYTNKSFEKSDGGYNFAFLANGRYAKWAAHKGKYGREAVMFQNSGVRAYHSSDEEEQIIFHGADVDPRMIILLRNGDNGWYVANSHQRNSRDYLYLGGDFEKCVQWVMAHYQTYRKRLFAR